MAEGLRQGTRYLMVQAWETIKKVMEEVNEIRNHIRKEQRNFTSHTVGCSVRVNRIRVNGVT